MNKLDVIRSIENDPIASLGKIHACLIEQTQLMSAKVTRENIQFVIKQLDLKQNRYVIIYGVPSDNKRHGIGEWGHLYEPVKKNAMVQAIDNNEIVIIQDASSDDRVSYMRNHIENKKIFSLAIIPIRFQGEVKWLIVIDKVEPCSRGFSVKDISILYKGKAYIEDRGIPLFSQGSALMDDLTCPGGVVEKLAHILRNRIMPLSGFAKRLLKVIPEDFPDSEKAKLYANIIINEMKISGQELDSFTNLVAHISPNGKVRESITFEQALAFFSHEKCSLEFDSSLLEEKIIIISGTLKELFKELARYIDQNEIEDEITQINAYKSNGFIELKFTNSSFQAFKNDVDSRLTTFRQIVENCLYGKFEVNNRECIISFPTRADIE
jgi:hypothetical protein